MDAVRSERAPGGDPRTLIAEIEQRLNVSVRGLSLRVLGDAPDPARRQGPGIGSNPEES